MFEKLSTFCEKNDLVFRILSILLSSLFFANIPTLLFLAYMGHYGFFSYDLFSEGIFAMRAFFVMTLLFLLVSSLSFSGFAFFITEKYIIKKKWRKNINKTKNKNYLGLIGSTFLFNFFMLVLVFFPIAENKTVFVFYVFIIGLFVSAHLAFIVYAMPYFQFRSLLIAIVVSVFVSFQYQEQLSNALSIVLRNYGIGGNIDVVVKSGFKDYELLTGKLLLTTPQQIYIKLKGNEEVSTISRAKIGSITVTKK